MCKNALHVSSRQYFVDFRIFQDFNTYRYSTNKPIIKILQEIVKEGFRYPPKLSLPLFNAKNIFIWISRYNSMRHTSLVNTRKYFFFVKFCRLKMILPKLLTNWNTKGGSWLEYGAPVTREGVTITSALTVL